MKHTYNYLVVLLFVPCLAWSQDSSIGGAFGSDGRYSVSGPVEVNGTVVGLENRPLDDVRVELRDTDTGQVVSTTYTLPNGSFAFERIPPGPYTVTAVAGLKQTQERVMIGMGARLTVRMPIAKEPQGGDQATISVSQLKVPDDARDNFEKAQKAFRKGELEKAQKYNEKALRIFPEYGQALTLEGILSMDQGKKDEARELLEKAVNADSSYGLGFIALGSVYNLFHRFDDALRVLDRGLSLAPNMWQGFFESAKALLGKGDFKGALQETDRARQLVPDKFAPIHLVRADAFIGLNNFPAAITELKEYLGQDPEGEKAAVVRRALDQLSSEKAGQ